MNYEAIQSATIYLKEMTATIYLSHLGESLPLEKIWNYNEIKINNRWTLELISDDAAAIFEEQGIKLTDEIKGVLFDHLLYHYGQECNYEDLELVEDYRDTNDEPLLARLEYAWGYSSFDSDWYIFESFFEEEEFKEFFNISVVTEEGVRTRYVEKEIWMNDSLLFLRMLDNAYQKAKKSNDEQLPFHDFALEHIICARFFISDVFHRQIHFILDHEDLYKDLEKRKKNQREDILDFIREYRDELDELN